MSWEGISSYLDKFRKIKPPNDAIFIAISKSLKDILGVDIPKEDMSISNNIVFINTSPTIKNEILFNKKALLSNIKKELLGTPISDIK